MKTKYSNPLKLTEDYLRRKKYSEQTIKMYVLKIESVVSFSENDIYHITVNDFNNYIDECILLNPDISHSFINQVVSAGKLFLKHGLNKTDKNIRALERPRSKKTIPTVLSIDEVYGMINSTNNLKHQCIIDIAFCHGLRRQEIIDLTIFDIDSKNMLLRVKNSKGDKDRNIPLNQDCLERLRRYWKQCKPSEFLFEGQDGQKYSATSIYNVVKNAAKLAGITKNVSPHTLRHSFTSYLVKLDVNLVKIREWMGHKHSTTTERYTHIVFNEENPIKFCA